MEGRPSLSGDYLLRTGQSVSRVSGSNGAEIPFKGYESSKLDQNYPFPAHFWLITSPFILSESKLVHVTWHL
jgi:hypothetical protein